MLLALAVAANSYAEYSIKYSYNETGQLASIDGARQEIDDTTYYNYNTNGQLQSISNALSHTTTYSNYDSLSNPKTITDENGLVSSLTYNTNGWITSITTNGAKTAITYNNIGQVTKITLADNSWLSYTWDKANRLTSVANNLGESINYSLDNMGNRIAETTKKGTTITRQLNRQFDELGRVTKIIGSANQTYQYSYGTHNKPISETDPKGKVITYQYDDLNQLVQDRYIKFYSYHDRDIWGNETRLKDFASTSYWFTYDDTDRIIREESETRGLTDYKYDHADNLVRQINGNGQTTHYNYDALNRLMSEVNDLNPELNVNYQYDQPRTGFYNIGKLTSIKDQSGTTQYNYNNQGLVAEQTIQYQLDGQPLATNTTYSYSYDKVGRITNINLAGNILKYTRNTGGQITAITLTQGTTNTIIANNINYLPFGEAITSLTWNNKLTLTRNYDLDGQLTQQKIGNVTTNYQYDPNGNITQLADSQFGITNYQYDVFNRLLKEQGTTNFTYAYDDAGNRTLKQQDQQLLQNLYFIYGNRLYDSRGIYYQADKMNNITAYKDYNLRYQYDESNRFAKVIKTVAGQETTLARYIHNAYGERTIKVKADGSISTFIYNDYGQLLNETQYDVNKQITHTIYWIWLDSMPIAQITIPYSNGQAQSNNQTIAYIHSDHLNTPRWATNQNQQILWTWNSDAYGNTLANEDPQNTGIKTTIPLRFAGQYFDEETGLHYNYFRTYNPDLGRYTQSDPIGIDGGWNTFTYVEGNPLSGIDFLGLNSLSRCYAQPELCKDALSAGAIQTMAKKGAKKAAQSGASGVFSSGGGDKGPSKDECDTALKIFEQYNRLYQKVNNKSLDHPTLNKLNNLRDTGKLKFYDLPGSLRGKMPGRFEGWDYKDVLDICGKKRKNINMKK